MTDQFKLLTLDFETYYDTKSGYTLSKMTAEEYIRDPRFQIIGVSVKLKGSAGVWVDNHNGKAVEFLRRADWSQLAALAHNMSEFDSLILTHHAGVRPARYYCTLAMARAVHGGNISKSLGKLAELYNLPAKGDEVIRADGKRLEHFTPNELAAYGRYCIHDTELCELIYDRLACLLPESERFYQHMLTRMWAEPRLLLDRPLLAAYLQQLTANKAALLARAGVTQEELRSDAKLAQLLIDLGVDPPLKLSAKQKNPDGTPKVVYAFAKTDAAMEELAEDEDEEVAVLIQARLGVKTTIEESRIARFIGIAERGPLPVPLAYGKTHTHRAAGSGKINMQNMGRPKPINGRTLVGTLVVTPTGVQRLEAYRERANGKGKVVGEIKTTGGVFWADDCHCVGLRDMIKAPLGKRIVVADSSNIELRVCHALAGQMDTIQKLAAGVDLYCDFAGTLYNRVVTKADKKERLHGKVGMLQLQYQAGAGSFRNAARVMGGLRLSQGESENTVKLYRSTYKEIRSFWYNCQEGIADMAAGKSRWLDGFGLCRIERNTIWLPNGMPLQYFDLRQEFDPERGQNTWVYDDKEKRFPKRVYGGSVTENLCQALARNIVFEQSAEIEKAWGRYEDVGTGLVASVHDEVVCLVDEDEADDCLKFMLDVMHESPTWWPTLPVAAEGAHATVYGNAK